MAKRPRNGAHHPHYTSLNDVVHERSGEDGADRTGEIAYLQHTKTLRDWSARARIEALNARNKDYEPDVSRVTGKALDFAAAGWAQVQYYSDKVGIALMHPLTGMMMPSETLRTNWWWCRFSLIQGSDMTDMLASEKTDLTPLTYLKREHGIHFEQAMGRSRPVSDTLDEMIAEHLVHRWANANSNMLLPGTSALPSLSGLHSVVSDAPWETVGRAMTLHESFGYGTDFGDGKHQPQIYVEELMDLDLQSAFYRRKSPHRLGGKIRSKLESEAGKISEGADVLADGSGYRFVFRTAEEARDRFYETLHIHSSESTRWDDRYGIVHIPGKKNFGIRLLGFDDYYANPKVRNPQEPGFQGINASVEILYEKLPGDLRLFAEIQFTDIASMHRAYLDPRASIAHVQHHGQSHTEAKLPWLREPLHKIIGSGPGVISF